MTRILVTGGGSGIGRAVARSFADEGGDVTITGRRSDALSETDGGRGMTCVTADVAVESDVAGLFDTPFDVVIANAGKGHAAKVVDTPLDVWNDILTINLTGVFLTFREALRGMGPGGRLIAIASTASLQGGPNLAAYAASKHGVLGLVRSLAQEIARKGITCNAVCPGFVDTAMAEGAVHNVMKRFDMDRDAAIAQITSRNPMRRMIEPDEVVAAVRFLASAQASMINGHAMSVSGGEI
jgi:NAD(P)-dependent dehydrogenase (short-subunit alcohol dehydrogenase family)